MVTCGIFLKFCPTPYSTYHIKIVWSLECFFKAHQMIPMCNWVEIGCPRYPISSPYFQRTHKLTYDIGSDLVPLYQCTMDSGLSTNHPSRQNLIIQGDSPWHK